MGAWIETFVLTPCNIDPVVAPLVGAWIETLPLASTALTALGRTPRGCVD